MKTLSISTEREVIEDFAKGTVNRQMFPLTPENWLTLMSQKESADNTDSDSECAFEPTPFEALQLSDVLTGDSVTIRVKGIHSCTNFDENGVPVEGPESDETNWEERDLDEMAVLVYDLGEVIENKIK